MREGELVEPGCLISAGRGASVHERRRSVGLVDADHTGAQPAQGDDHLRAGHQAESDVLLRRRRAPSGHNLGPVWLRSTVLKRNCIRDALKP